MCGIWLCCGDSDFDPRSISGYQELIALLKNRGPDHYEELSLTVESDINKNHEEAGCTKKLHIFSSVLWTQGTQMSSQPFVTNNKSRCMLYNGDIYKLHDHIITEAENDGQALFDELNSCSSLDDIVRMANEANGPFAFVYVDLSSKKIIFGRDFFGRESLLFSCNEDWFSMSSLSPFQNSCEIPALGIFCLDLNTYEIVVYPYSCHPRTELFKSLDHLKQTMKPFGFTLNEKPLSVLKDNFAFKTCLNPTLDDFVNSPMYNSVLQAKALSAGKDMAMLQTLLYVSEVLQDVIQEFIQLLRDSVRKRFRNGPKRCKNCVEKNSIEPVNALCDHSKISVLFSGGIDSTVIAHIVLELLPPGESIDFINVAFHCEKAENDHLGKRAPMKQQQNPLPPDRVTGLQSYGALKEIHGDKKNLNFIAVDIEKSEMESIRKNRIRHLVSPMNSVLDDSLACCLWFAARGKGSLIRDPSEKDFPAKKYTPYDSPARIVFLGSGADELLGGYSRHSKQYQKNGWSGLAAEMQTDIDRISLRNMGRDNRVLCDHGVSPRMPFLDESLVSFLTEKCQIWTKCCPTLKDRALSEKLLLRATALKLLGTKNADLTLFPKRAMQFGTRIVKLESRKNKGHFKCAHLL